MGEFFKSWLQLKISVEQIINPMAVVLLEKIKGRESKLLENNVVSAAMFLDPRFHCTMSQPNKVNSIAHLKNLYKHQHKLREIQQEPLVSNTSIPPRPSTSSSSSNIMNIHNLMNAYIAEHNQAKCINSMTNNSTTEKAFIEIDNYSPQPMDVNINVLDYWTIKREEFPHLSILAEIVHAVPATQCSVERCFSALKLLLSDQRNKLSPDTINEIILVRCNSDFEYADYF